MRLRYLVQASYWKYLGVSLLSSVGWSVPGYVARANARQRMGDEQYIARLQLQYGATALALLLPAATFLILGTGITGALTTLALFIGVVYFGIRVLRVSSLYQPVASSVGMQRAWAQLPADNAVVLHVQDPLMIDYWDAVDSLKTLPLRGRMQWHLREWLQR